MKSEHPTLELAEQTKGAVEPSGDLSIPQLIDKLSQTPSLTLEQVTVVEKLLAMQERQEQQRRKELFDEALRQCQMEMPRVAKNGLVKLANGKAIYSYAKLEDLDACIRDIYQGHGFSVSYDAPMSVDGAKIRNIARFSCAGHTEVREISAAPSNRSAGNLTLTDAQKTKQTITECRRHLLEMFFNVITEGADEPNKDDKPISQEDADTLRSILEGMPNPQAAFKRMYEIYGISKLEELMQSELKDAHQRLESARNK